MSSSGLSDQGAREFHRLFMMSFIGFTVIAIVAHFLVWQWRPWFPEVGGYTAITDGLNVMAQSVMARLS